MVKLYRVANWNETYETHETRKLETLRWVAIPNRLDGLGYRRVAQDKRRAELFSAWVLIIEIASRGRKEERGTLSRDGQPLTAEDLGLMTGFPADLFEAAFTFFTRPQMGWLECVDISSASDSPGNDPGEPGRAADDAAASTGQTPLNGMEGREGMEGNGMGGREPPGKPGAASQPGRPSRLVPSDFRPDAATLMVASQCGLTGKVLDNELAKFRDHEFKAPHSDWQKAARNWIRRAPGMGTGAPNARAAPRFAAEVTSENGRRLMDESIAEHEQEQRANHDKT